MYMQTLHKGPFARLFALLAIVGLLLSGATTTVMAMPSGQTGASHHGVMLADDMMHMTSASSADDMMHITSASSDACKHAGNSKMACADDEGYQCSTGNCCPHGASGLPPQGNTAARDLPRIYTAAPQWRAISVTPVTEIRPPITTL